jgi:biotin carboxyl carrier protein
VKKLRVTVNGVSYEVEVEILEDDEESSQNYSAVAPPVQPGSPVPSAPQARPAPSTGDKKELTSPIAGVVTEIRISAGTVVKENDLLVIIEAMKMNTNIASPVNGKVKEIKVKAGEAVQQGQVLITFV